MSPSPSPARRRSCCRNTGPCPHGPVLHTVSPAYPAVAGGSELARQAARSPAVSSPACRSPGAALAARLRPALPDPPAHAPLEDPPPRRLDLRSPAASRRLRLVDNPLVGAG